MTQQGISWVEKLGLQRPWWKISRREYIGREKTVEKKRIVKDQKSLIVCTKKCVPIIHESHEHYCLVLTHSSCSVKYKQTPNNRYHWKIRYKTFIDNCARSSVKTSKDCAVRNMAPKTRTNTVLLDFQLFPHSLEVFNQINRTLHLTKGH